MLHDIQEMLRWGRQIWHRGHPTNKELDGLLERLLRGKGGFLLRSHNVDKSLRRASDDKDNPLHTVLHDG